ncbi:MAG: DUF1700 domain-containing protein [Massiliimalia sp.]
MTRTEYMQQLHHLLRRLPEDEYQSAMRYYNEYFNEAGDGNEQRVIAQLGDPKLVAEQIIANYTARKNASMTARMGKNNKLSPLWMLLLCICAIPIAIPLTLTGIACSAAVVLTLVLLYLSLLLIAVVVLASGFCFVLAGIAVILQGPATTVLFVGVGLAAMGIGGLLLILILGLWKKTFALFSRFYHSHISKRKVG